MNYYKNCPLKKRPVFMPDVYDQPQDLSMKRYSLNRSSSSISEQNYYYPGTQNFNINLTSNSFYDQIQQANSFYNECPSEEDHRSYSPATSSSSDELNNSIGYYSNESSVSSLTPPPSPIYNYYSSSLSSSSEEPEDLSVKSTININTKIISSPYCNNQFKKTKTTLFGCNKCGKSYSTSTGLSKHEEFHCPKNEKNQIKRIYRCTECDKEYSSMGALKMHIRTHTLPCKCNLCGKSFSRPWLLQGHIRTHTGEKPFNCDQCARSFADRSNLRAHQQTHYDVKKYNCNNCEKSFSRMSLLSKHKSNGCVLIVC